MLWVMEALSAAMVAGALLAMQVPLPLLVESLPGVEVMLAVAAGRRFTLCPTIVEYEYRDYTITKVDTKLGREDTT